MTDILLVHIEGQRYAVRKEEVESIKDIGHLHRLPVSSACIAGVSIIDGRSVILASLPACVGRASLADKSKDSILMLSGHEQISGFVTHGNIDIISITPDAFLPIPDYLRTDVIDTCVLHDSDLLPVINLHQVVQQLLKTGHERPRAFIAHHKGSATAINRFRIFEIGNDLFAADAENTEAAAAERRPAAALPGVPAYVKGISVHGGSVLPVIDLSKRIRPHAGGNAGVMLIAEIAAAKFGMLIDRDHGVLSSGDVRLLDIPPIARSPWLSKAIVRSGDLIPLIDLAALLSEPQDGAAPLDRRYHPDPAFHFLFRKADAEVVEFSLLGARHAIPKSEVENIIPIIPWRMIPGMVPDIMIGAALHQGNILPVLDLAMVFGRQSGTAADWRMIVIRNGDFRALVIAETVFGERLLPLNVQREVPILLEHNPVYGCYPDGDEVRLIFNVEAMTVYFEKSLAKDLAPALSHGINPVPAEVVTSTVKTDVTDSPDVITELSAYSARPDVDDDTAVRFQEKGIECPVGENIAPELQGQNPEQEKFEEEQSTSAAETKSEDEEKNEPKPELTAEEGMTAVKQIEGRSAGGAVSYQESSGDYGQGKWLRYAAIVAVLVFAVYGINTYNRREARQLLKETAPTVEETASEKTEPAESKIEAAPKSRPTLVLEVPAHMELTADVYIVVKGDTLWSLSERFTGNPFNYPRIAGDNRIADPDLIFPGQKILLMKKQHVEF